MSWIAGMAVPKYKRGRRLGAVLGMLLLVLCACDSSSPTEPQPMVASVTGTWDGSVEVLGGTAAEPGTTGTFVTTLTQSGTAVSGTFAFEDGDSGTVSGTVTGQSLAFELIQTTAGCPGSFTGAATLATNNLSMSGEYSGEACGGTITAQFSAVKRQ